MELWTEGTDSVVSEGQVGNRVCEEESTCSKLPVNFHPCQMRDWLKLLIFSNLLIIQSFGRAVASHSVGGWRPPFFFFFLMSSMKGKLELFFFLLKLLMILP